MDELENGMLVGTYPGHFVGEVTLVHGKVNKALYTNGIDQWVNIGNHRDKCLGNLARCTKGFVMALWLRAPTDPTGRKHFYVNSGGHISKSMGIILHQKNMKLNSQFIIHNIFIVSQHTSYMIHNVSTQITFYWHIHIYTSMTSLYYGSKGSWKSYWIDGLLVWYT